MPRGPLCACPRKEKDALWNLAPFHPASLNGNKDLARLIGNKDLAHLIGNRKFARLNGNRDIPLICLPTKQGLMWCRRENKQNKQQAAVGSLTAPGLVQAWGQML